MALSYLVSGAVITSPVRMILATVSRKLPLLVRLWLKLLIYCPLCSAFWIGLVLGLMHFYPAEQDAGFALHVIEAGLAAMAVAIPTFSFTNIGSDARESEEDAWGFQD